MRMELAGEKRASRFEGIFLVGASQWEEGFPVGKELPGGREELPWGRELLGGKEASWWEESFPVGRELPGGKGSSQ